MTKARFKEEKTCIYNPHGLMKKRIKFSLINSKRSQKLELLMLIFCKPFGISSWKCNQALPRETFTSVRLIKKAIKNIGAVDETILHFTYDLLT